MKKSASYSNSFPTQDWVRETIPRLILMDDAFMRVVLKDMKCTEYILQIVLNKPDLRVKSQNLQMDLKNLQGRSLILNCYCTDNNGTVYNIEIQNRAQGASPLRARYHSGMIDMNIRDNTELGKLIEDFYIADPKKMHSKVQSFPQL